MSRSTSGISFGPFRLDQDAVRLWKGAEPVALQSRPLAVLSYLAARPGTLVGRDELIDALWGGTYVTKAVLKVAVRAIREALEDSATAPRYIETVGREGYRFIGAGAPTAAAPATEAVLVGRDADLAVLQQALARAAQGEHTLLLVSGEAGVGKTTLIDRFVADLPRGVRVARGQCLEHYGEGEAYLPILDAIGHLVRDGGAPELQDILRRHAPSWVSQLPALAPRRAPVARDDAALAPKPSRMLREMADALELFTRTTTLALVLEDLQWSDRSTVDLLGYIARRRQPARLLVVGSVRSAEMIVHEHPLRALQQELQAAGRCDELALELLSASDVKAYVEARFAGAPTEALRRLAARIHERTDGNALFMTTMVNELVAGGMLAWGDGGWRIAPAIEAATDQVPIGLQDLISRRIQGLPAAARRVLEVASVVGEEFTVAAVAAGLQEDAASVEARCEQLATQGGLIAEVGVAEWPDGTLTGRYRFLHALYRRVLYDGIGGARRVRLHRAVGLREELGFGAQAGAHAAVLAMHFGRGHDHARALDYHELAGAAALKRHASHEAVGHFSAALEALARLPAAVDGPGRQLRLVVARATLLMATRGYAAVETQRDFARASALCDVMPDSPALYPVLRGLISYHHVRAELSEAAALGERLLRHAGSGDADADRALRVQAHYAQGATLFHQGALDLAGAHLASALREYDAATHPTHALVYGGYDPGVACSMWQAWTLALQGRLAEAARLDAQGMALARALPDAFSLAWACYAAGVSQQFFGDWVAAEAASAEAVELAEEYGFPHVLGMATVTRGWSVLMQGRVADGIALLRDGVAQVEATGARLVRSAYLGMLATADALQGDRAAAARRFDEALADIAHSGERVHEAGLLIGRSHLLAGGGPGGRTSRASLEAAEACLHRALALAREQGARLLELRAAVALTRHSTRHGRAGEGGVALRAALAWFADQPPATAEIAAARHLLDELDGA